MGKEIFVGNTSNIAEKPLIFIGSPNNIAKEPFIFVGNPSNEAVKVYPSNRLPDIYQKVEYIFNVDKTQYINTGIYPNSDTRCVLTFNILDENYSENREPFFGCCYYSYLYAFYYPGYALVFHRISNVTPDISGSFGDSSAFQGISISTGHKHIFDFNYPGGKFFLDDRQIGSSQKTFNAYNYPIMLFAAYKWGDTVYIDRKVEQYIYSFKAYQHNVLIRDMYPCYLKSDPQTVGMYDLINDVFYGNDGTGIFYKGPDVSD